MTQEQRGWRALPLALRIALVAWFCLFAARFVWIASHDDFVRSARFTLVTEGTTFALFVLAILGTLDLARRLAGRERLGVRIATVGLAAAFVVDIGFGLVSFMSDPWKHRSLYTVLSHGYFVAWFSVPVGLAVAAWHRRAVALALPIVSFLAVPPPLLGETLYGWLDLSRKSGWFFDMSLRAVNLAVIVVGFIVVARGAIATSRPLAAHGLRSAAKALWLRVIAAVGLALLTLVVIAGKGGTGSLEVLRLAMVTAAVINILALVQFGLGATRAARAEVSELGRWPLLAAGGTALWGAGVMLAQLPYVYKALYQAGDSFMRDMHAEYMQSLAIALPVLVTVGIGLLAIAINGLAARNGNENLRAEAQGKGIGFVMLMLVSLAIQLWMLPKAGSLGAFTLLTLLAAGASLAATVLMAKLCGLGAEELEREPGLPTATVVA